MIDVYERLAKHLDNLPASYPATDSGVELRILKRLFTPEEAEAAMALTMFPEPADALHNIEQFCLVWINQLHDFWGNMQYALCLLSEQSDAHNMNIL